LVLFPALTLSVVVIAVNLLGDAMRDILDPRLREPVAISSSGR
jgi:peptide/nickel transport system permease protein